MDGDELIGWLMALAWLGLFVYIPVIDIRRAGSVRAWARGWARRPLEAVGCVLLWAGCSAFLLWLLTAGAVSVKLAWLAPVGLLVLLAARRFRSMP